jgi:transcriptional regulator with XRE-family HTH domain
MPLKPDEIKRRIEGARILRNISQKEFDRLGHDQGYGRGEMSRVERGDIEYRPGKHLDVLCRILRVPRWWFTADELDFGRAEDPASPDEIASLLAQQTLILQELKEATAAELLARNQAQEATKRLLGVVDEHRPMLRGDAQSQEEAHEKPAT